MKNIHIIPSETLTPEDLSKLGETVQINSGAIALYTKWNAKQLQHRARTPMKVRSGNPLLIVDISVVDGLNWTGIHNTSRSHNSC
jgi:hypothetical protein